MSSFIHDDELSTLEALRALADLNPFLLEEREELERKALGGRRLEEPERRAPLHQLAERSVELLRERLTQGARPPLAERELYEALVRYWLFERYQHVFIELLNGSAQSKGGTVKVAEYARYRGDFAKFLEVPGLELPGACSPAHLFAWGFQIRRAYLHAYRQIYGGSAPAARLRAAVWQSIFTHDTDRYRRTLYRRMGDVTTLILGESGTGKELVARAIGLSRYVPFDEKRAAFVEDYNASFHPVNLSALSASLIESELFGHRRGSFTGAVSDHTGWLEACSASGTVFLDEIAELDMPLQVKLLRVLQARRFHRVGETKELEFTGKIVAATNRDPAREITAGRFRSDLYYRLCSDLIHTPTLREQIAESPDELPRLVNVLCARIAGEEEAESLARDVVRWVETHLDARYPWPGNVRELEQCVRNVMVRGEYRPLVAPSTHGSSLAELLERGELSADDLLRHYCTRSYAKTGSYEESARRLGLDRRTIKAKIDLELLERLRG